jgi:hypothetical protein
MINIEPSQYRKDPFIGVPQPLVVDEKGNVLEYIVDTYSDMHAPWNSPPNDYYREHIRFKVNRNTIEAYYGQLYGGVAWKVYDILSTHKVSNFDEEYVVSLISNWYKDAVEQLKTALDEKLKKEES